MTLGHEFVGVVAEKGSQVFSVEIGDRVSAEGHIVCGLCRNCRAGAKHACSKTIGLGIHKDGAFAEYVKIPKDNIYKIPSNISNSEAAIFDPFGNAVFASSIFNVSGEDVLITGAGPVGVMTALVCQHLGARKIVITDVNDFRLNLLSDEPRIFPLNIKNNSIEEITGSLNIDEGFNLLFEMSGNNTAFKSLIQASGYGANIISLGVFPEDIQLDFNKIIFKNINIRGIYGRAIFDTWYKMTAYLQSGLSLKRVITHHLKYQDYEKGFDLLKKGEACKVILKWS